MAWKRNVKRAVAPVVRSLAPWARRYIQGMPSWMWKSKLLLHSSVRWIDRDFTVKTIFGATMSGNTEDTVQNRIYFFGKWEPVLTEWVRNGLREGDVFVDCGANIGYFSLLASRCVGTRGKVIAIEASPSIAAELKRNVESNDAKNVAVYQVALGDERGVTRVYHGPRTNVGGTALVPVVGGFDEGVVDTVPLADLIPLELRTHVRFVKIDVEGSEFAVLRGLGDLGTFDNPDLEFAIEVTEQSATLIDVMAKAGFYPYWIPNDYDELSAYVRNEKDVSLKRFDGRVGGLTDLLFSRKCSSELRVSG